MRRIPGTEEVKEQMKKLFTIDDFSVAVISALGYGFGEVIAKLSGWSMLVCGLISFVIGIALEAIMHKLVFSKAVQKSTTNRVITYIICFMIFMIVHIVSFVQTGVSMLDYLLENFVYVVGLPILGFVVNLLIRAYRVGKIRERYGDGRKGYMFDVKEEDIEEVNRQNRLVCGEYDETCAAKTKTGVFVGEKGGKTIGWFGIPYAKPPVGERRWKAPEALPVSEAIFEARHFGASAVQVDHDGSIVKYHRQSEDCLTLNVWSAAQKTEIKKPVLVLFHHGDFTCGSSVDPLLYGDQFVGRHPGIVFVSFNVRLGIFGFIDFSEVPGGEAYPDAINLGLLDQIAALKWIKENIAAFGGDPARITVLGFDAGATSVCLLAACEQAKGLFQKAFVFNGSPASAYGTPEGARDLARDLLKETKTGTMEELQRLDTESLKKAAQKLWQNMCAPTCDGSLIPADMDQAFRNGIASGIEFVVGIPGHEMQAVRSFVGNQKYTAGIMSVLADLQSSMDPSAADTVREYLETQTASSDNLDAESKLVEQWLALCMVRCAASLSEGGNNVYLMYWDEKPLIKNLGSGTMDVVAAMLGNSEATQMYGNVLNADLSETLQCLLEKYISGDTLQLYSNEIKGIDAFDREAFPLALIVSDGSISCNTLEDRLTEVKGLKSVPFIRQASKNRHFQ